MKIGRPKLLLVATATVYVAALALPAVAVPIPFTTGATFAAWQATFFAMGEFFAPSGPADDILSPLLFGASFASNLLFLAGLVVASRVAFAGPRRPQRRVSVFWEWSLVAALALNSYWFINAQLHGDATSTHQSRVADSTDLARGVIVVLLPTLLRCGYYLWLLSFALLAFAMHRCRKALAEDAHEAPTIGAARAVERDQSGHRRTWL